MNMRIMMPKKRLISGTCEHSMTRNVELTQLDRRAVLHAVQLVTQGDGTAGSATPSLGSSCADAGLSVGFDGSAPAERLDPDHEPQAERLKRRFELLELRAMGHRQQAIDLRQMAVEPPRQFRFPTRASASPRTAPASLRSRPAR